MATRRDPHDPEERNASYARAQCERYYAQRLRLILSGKTWEEKWIAILSGEGEDK